MTPTVSWGEWRYWLCFLKRYSWWPALWHSWVDIKWICMTPGTEWAGSVTTQRPLCFWPCGPRWNNFSDFQGWLLLIQIGVSSFSFHIVCMYVFWYFKTFSFLPMISPPDPVSGEEFGRNADESRWVCWNAGYGELAQAMKQWKMGGLWMHWKLMTSIFASCNSSVFCLQIRNDTSQIVNENLPQIQQKSDEMRQIYRRIDKLEVSDHGWGC